MDPPQWTSVTDGHLGKLMIPRASGSKNNTLVQNYISSVYQKLNWHEEKVSFTSATPIGEVDFTNLIYTFDPEAPRKLVVAAHFDSKWFPDYPANQFIGATDSAAPCALLLALSEYLTPLLTSRSRRLASGQPILRPNLEFDEEDAAATTLQIIFFDGEEAFHDWTDKDSIYGARWLAEEWSNTYLDIRPGDSVSGYGRNLAPRRQSPIPTQLDTIDHLVLLDLIGNSHSSIHSFFRETDWLFDMMARADNHLRQEGLVQIEPGEETWFKSERRWGGIGDDHVPFLEKGIPILHIISTPFPKVWHTLGDDASALSLSALQRWNRILRVFVCEYMGLFPEDVQNGTKQKRVRDDLVRASKDKKNIAYRVVVGSRIDQHH
nr:glutaminyl cyclase [Cryptococcus depauperatus CBS 7841]